MRNAVELLNEYIKLVGEGDFEKVLELFAPDAIFEFPFFQSVGIGGRMDGIDEIRNQVGAFMSSVDGFKFQNVTLFAAADPQRAFGEYSVSTRVKQTGRVYNQLYAGRLESENGKIKLLREFANPIEAAISSLENGLDDVKIRKASEARTR